jgi:hypothetical protein
MVRSHQELRDRTYEKRLAAVNHPAVTATVTNGECRIARITCARSLIRACARAGIRPAKASMFMRALKAAWPAPVKAIACTPEARPAMTSRSSLRRSGCKMLTFSGRSKVIQRARPRCWALIPRVQLRLWRYGPMGEHPADGIDGADSAAVAATWCPAAAGAAPRSASRDVGGDRTDGRRLMTGAQHACRAAKAADSPPANPPEVWQSGILPR